MLTIREITRCSHGRMELEEFVITNPNPMDSTEVASREKEMIYWTLRNWQKGLNEQGRQ